ncbi:response regulator [Mucilaginibacter sp. BJC16-A38]|uniref:response regulator n=1 Tax=Mucilaginibacter phenanthrenivorans TaxID=1234842 RepID=UPI0021570C61|nr:response regulator [Mucilaginibacter phenanthrenivorans]MCR8557273.1 response regulator [Mucilaginibacter phenanthrenivorans]
MSNKILIVEDDHDILGILTDVLQQDGYEVTALNYTDSIINSITQHQPDLVLLDFLLAGINGGELCHEIKMHKEYGGLPVIMLSAFPRVLDSLGNYGSDAFIAKPFDIAVLLRKVKDCLESRMAHA